MAFKEMRLPERISFGAVGGPGFNTSITILGSGHESRNQNWEQERGRWEISYNARRARILAPLPKFFRVAGGRANSFRFKDWSDFAATYAEGVVGLGVGTGEPALQLGKKYTFGAFSAFRDIHKPNPTPAIKKNGTLLTEGVNPGNWEIDLSSGLVTFVATATKTITGITNAGIATVTSAAHGFTNGLVIYIVGVAGMTEVNFLPFVVAGVTTNTFQLTGVNSSLYGTYTSGGTASIFPQPGDTLTAEFEFDVPVRFDNDEMRLEIIDKKNGTGEFIVGWQSVQIVEVRPE